nr:UDP-N-acetylglucosamine 2-epimerase (non-hydrolyzing) [Sulfoacidibacillus ferrooxidans]
MTIFGTRPEAVKMAPLVKELQANADFETVVCVTAQHREQLDQVLSAFSVFPDYDLNVMEARQTLTKISTKVLELLASVLEEVQPDIVLVHGDTTTTFIASLAAFYQQIAIGHVEAGLRTWDKYSPYPEEMNRQLTGVIADLHFAPTKVAADNLLREGKQEQRIYITGNTAIDAMRTTVHADYEHPELAKIGANQRLIYMTAHRRENIGEGLLQIFTAVREVVDLYPDVYVIYPVHLNPAVREPAHHILGDHPRIALIDPLEVMDAHNFMAKAYLILTDSGGVQEEAPFLGIPCLVLRDTTERPEGIEAGTLRLVGTKQDEIIRATRELLDDTEAYERMSVAASPYGDGFASRRIVQALRHYFNQGERPELFVPKPKKAR